MEEVMDQAVFRNEIARSLIQELSAA